MVEKPSLPQKLVDTLAKVRSVGAITGSGVSKESGLPTYRGKGGIYDNPEEGDQMLEAVSAPMLEKDPDRTWRAVVAIARQSQEVQPNASHRALVQIERKVASFVLLTQNVDGLHQLAGSRNIIDIHGDAFSTLCMECGALDRIADLLTIEKAPHCRICDGILRPNVVLFGEMLPRDKVMRIYRQFHTVIPDLVLVAGTTALFQYIMEPVFLASAKEGRVTVEINPERTILSDAVHYSLRGSSSDYLPLIAEAIPASK